MVPLRHGLGHARGHRQRWHGRLQDTLPLPADQPRPCLGRLQLIITFALGLGQCPELVYLALRPGRYQRELADPLRRLPGDDCRVQAEHRFSDWGANQVIALGTDGSHEVVVTVASFPMCIDFLPDGRLLVVDSAQRRLLRRESDGSLVTHADLSGVSTKPWNDIVVDDRGNAYVNTIGFDFPGGEFAPGLVVLARPDGDVRQVAGDVAFPNGMAITPDGGTLIVAESYANWLTAYDIAADRRTRRPAGVGGDAW